MPGGTRNCDRTDRQGECNGDASRAYRAARAMPPPGAKGPATAKAERSADPSDPRGSVRRRAFLGSTRGSGARTRRKKRPPMAARPAAGTDANPAPAGRNRPGCRKRQLPMARASMSGQRPRGFASRTARFQTRAWSGERTRLRAAAVEAGSDAGLHLHWAFVLGASLAGERGAWIAHPQPLPQAGGERDLRHRRWR